jgi:hypothetical protein
MGPLEGCADAIRAGARLTTTSSVGPRVCFVSASGQNAFFEELLEAIRKPLEATGIRTESAVDHFPPLCDDLVYVFVPHEYVPFTLPIAHPSPAQLRRTVVLATEQPGTSWFDESAAFASRAAATVDINELGVSELARRGIRARLLQLGYVPDWDFWHRRDEPRPIDVTFLGGYTERRALALARCGSVLSNYRTSLRIVDTRPHTADDAFFLSGERKFRHLAASKVILSAHREANAYLEWQRLLCAAANGCVVLTEHSSGFAPLVPGEHFASVSFDNLPLAIAGLLEDEGALARIRYSAYEFIRIQMPLSESIDVLASAIDDAARQPIRNGGAASASVAAPKPAPEPLVEWKRIETEPEHLRTINASIKRLTLQQRRLERELAALKADSAVTDVRHYGLENGEPARITVVLTVFNCSSTVGEAIESVALADTEVELVVVDDASTDDSVEVLDRALQDAPWQRAKLLRRGRNEGLPAARNLAVENASGDYIFVLDGDNTVYHGAFTRLAEALDDDPHAAFAYGILEKFDTSGPVGLTSWVPWQPEQLKYGNRIDAMAMLRRAAFQRVGGYLTDDRIHGWEDFALWCAFAQQGMPGVSVPEIIGRYRSSAASMISTTMIDTTDAWGFLLGRFPFLRDEAGAKR